MLNIDGVENLKYLSYEAISNLKYFKANEYEPELIKKNRYEIFLRDDNVDNLGKTKFESIDILKIGTIKAKRVQLSVYNLHLQFRNRFFKTKDPKEGESNVISTLGNLNTTGISD